MEAKKASNERAITETRVLEVIRGLLTELGSYRALRGVRLQASLERDLGLGSLERVELLLRLEKEFSIRLPDRVMTEAETPTDLVRALLGHESGPPENFQTTAVAPQWRVQPPGSAGVNKQVDKQTVQGVAPFPAAGLSVLAFGSSSPATLNEALRQFAQLEPQRPHIYLGQDNGETRTISYGELFEGALALAEGLLERGLEHGQTVAIMLPTGQEFFLSFFGTLLAGCIPVPIYPPYRTDRLEEYAQRQVRILDNAEVRLLITFDKAERLARLLRPRIPSLSAVLTVQRLHAASSNWRNGTSSQKEVGAFRHSDNGRPFGAEAVPGVQLQASTPEDIALIQYTSGSTGDPKGVVLTHANLLANIRAIGQALDIRPTDVGVSWLPLYHDMGLIASWLYCLCFGIPIVILSPLAFLSRPERWLWAIHHHRATLSAAPNFAYELCVRKTEPQALEGLDLSCWRAAFNGAEPVNPETLERFSRRFGAYGFRPESLLPVYGLAESTVALTVPPLGRKPRVDSVARESLETESKAKPAESGQSALRFVSVGRPLVGHEVRVVDDEGHEVGERVQAHIQFRGPSTMIGYFRNPQATQAVSRDGWVDSGDLGYLADGELFVTGRLKDIIIKGGRNFYPQEVEEVTSQVDGIRRGCVVAFGVTDARLGTERLVVIAETGETKSEGQDRLVSEVIARVDSSLGIPPDVVQLVPPHTVPKTSSGKIRRDACRNLYLQGGLARRRLPAWLQLLKLSALGAWGWLDRSLRRTLEIVYGSYAWLVFATIGLPCGLLMLVSPSHPRSGGARAILRFACRASLRLTGLCPRIEGREHLADNGVIHGRAARHVLLVSNHASYLDPFVLVAALPFDFLFVIKREAASWPVIGTLIRKCGYLTVSRTDASQAAPDSQSIAHALEGGLPVHVFPEGTFARPTGLRPFHLGAFKVAVETGCPIVPVTLRGVRDVLRDGTWLPRHRPIRLTVSPPLLRQGSDWQEMVRLRDVVREEILKYCGEGSLDLVLAGPPRP
jgi:fatty-acyl-CoA synthase